MRSMKSSNTPLVHMRSASSIADGIRSGREKAVDVVKASLDRIEQKNAVLNAFVALDPERALREARSIDARVAAGEDPGAFAGVPFGVKDLEDLEGFTTVQGSLLHLEDPPATSDAIPVARLRAAGAIALGKTATPEFGLDSSTYSRAHGVTRNPWNPEMTPGGSSGGSSAAVASGMVPIATATDGGGSIREPAAFTGLVGLKPSHGRIPQESGFSSFSCKGAVSLTVRDTARFLDVASGPDDRDRQSLPVAGFSYEAAIETADVEGLRAVWSSDHGYAVMEPEVIDIAKAAAERLIKSARLIQSSYVFEPTNVYQHWGRIALMNLKTEFERSGVLPEHRSKLSVQTQHYLDLIDEAGIIDTYESDLEVRKLTKDVAGLFQKADLLLSPATATAPYKADIMIPTQINGQDASHSGVEPFGMLANFCWNPSISIPAGLTASGLPVGLQITARRHQDHILLRLARILEQTQPWSFPWADGID
jgi:aspartyl-tRNA(Asn)/glutamyl-tRNA(Gln) amidotransferase subunit A